MTPVGNGWYRCTVSRTALASSGAYWQINMATADNSINFTGDGYSGVYIWGAQLEAGSFATSYIPTVASQVTRSLDLAIMTGTNFSSWYRADEGTLYAQASSNAPQGTNNRVLWIRNSATGLYDDAIVLDVRRGASNVSFNVRVSAVDQALLQPTTLLQENKAAFAYRRNDFAGSVNSSTVSTDTTGSVPVVNQMTIGWHSDNTNLNGTIKKVAYYPARLQNSELQALTTI
jgi:hypothetical protein